MMHIFAQTMFWLQIVHGIINFVIALGTSNPKEERGALLRLVFNVGFSVWGGFAIWS